MTSRSNSVGDSPESNASKLLPTLGGIFIILLFYLFVGATILFLAVLIAVELVAGFLGGRFRWAFNVRRTFRGHFALAGVLLQSLRLRKVVENCIPLTPEDAPELFSMLESMCLQRGITFPPDVFVEMEAGAWVRLKGCRRGAGKVALGLGFDLLAGTTQSELQAVIAHELSHAKLTQRTVRNWLARGLERAVQLSRGLSNLTAPRREWRILHALRVLFCMFRTTLPKPPPNGSPHIRDKRSLKRTAAQRRFREPRQCAARC